MDVAGRGGNAGVGDRTGLGLGILGVALLLGWLGDALLNVTPWGINLGLWTAAAITAALALAAWRGVALTGGGRWLLLPALGFAAAVAWRDSAVLGTLNGLALLLTLSLAAMRGRRGRLIGAGLVEYAIAPVLTGLYAALGLLLVLVNDIAWRALPRTGWSSRLPNIGCGLVLAIQLLLLFGGLFAAADAAFAGLIMTIFRLDIVDLVEHTIIIGFVAWVVGGVLHLALFGDLGEFTVAGWSSPLRLGIVELSVVLGALDALFLAFVVVQVRYFFGGANLVETSATLTYADSARRGFFELVWVAALMLPLLLAADWVLRAETDRQRQLFRILAGGLIALLFVIMASALQRMRLYTAEYGLTELRFYTTAFMGWLAVLLVWFCLTVLPGARRHFAFGALASGLAAVLLLNVVNPDDLIVRTNVGRLASGRPLDTAYLTALSADAVPALVEALPLLPDRPAGIVAAHILRRWSPPAATDWRIWNAGRVQAWQVTSTHQATLQRLAPTRR